MRQAIPAAEFSDDYDHGAGRNRGTPEMINGPQPAPRWVQLVHDAVKRTGFPDLLLGLALILTSYRLIAKLVLARGMEINVDKFRDYVFINELFNERILLHGASSGIKGVSHGALGYWALYPFVLLRDYYAAEIFITILNLAVLILFAVWLSRKFSPIFSLTFAAYVLCFFPSHFLTPSHFAFVMAACCALFFFLVTRNLFGLFFSTFCLFHSDVAYWVLFFPYLLICLKQRGRAYAAVGLFFILYFLLYIVRGNSGDVFDLSFVSWGPSRSPYSSDILTQIVLASFGFIVLVLLKIRGNDVEGSLFRYLCIFYLLVFLPAATLLSGKISYFVVPAAMLTGYGAHLVYRSMANLFLRYAVSFSAALSAIVFFAFGSVSPGATYSGGAVPQEVDTSPGYFLDNAFVGETSRLAGCGSGVYQILLSSKFADRDDKSARKFLLLSPSELRGIEDTATLDLHKVGEAEGSHYQLLYVGADTFPDTGLDVLHPLSSCLSVDERRYYRFYNLGERRVEKIDLRESYEHFIAMSAARHD